MNISEIQKIKNKITTQGWPKFVMSLSIDKLHGLKEKHIEFKFPICAIVGENGTCKSTILKLLACAYKGEQPKDGFFPSDFFPDTLWENFQNVEVEYQTKQGQKIETYKVTKPSERWRGLPERPENKVFYFDLNRIQSIESLIGASKVANKKIQETKSRNLKEDSINKISEIMERKYLEGRYATTNASDSLEVGLLKLNFGEISKFHQGSGEAMILDLISVIENIPDFSLVIVDEIESSLHPKAQRRLIQNLLELTRTKTLQIVLSTHSPYILSELPEESRILLKRTNDDLQVVYAPSVEFCLSQIDDALYSELDLLVEDEEAKIILDTIIRLDEPNLIQKVRILPVGSANIIKILAKLSHNSKLPYKILGILDGDIEKDEFALSLPGKFNPEKQIIIDITTKGEEKILSLMLNVSENEIKSALANVITIQDSKLWVETLANKFNISPETLWRYLVGVWVRKCITKKESEEIIKAIKERLES